MVSTEHYSSRQPISCLPDHSYRPLGKTYGIPLHPDRTQAHYSGDRIGIRAITLGEKCGGLSADPLCRCETKGGWIINGMKYFISNASRACFFLFFGQTEKGKSRWCMRVDRGEVIGRATIFIN